MGVERAWGSGVRLGQALIRAESGTPDIRKPHQDGAMTKQLRPPFLPS